jgi:hypothetical protein
MTPIGSNPIIARRKARHDRSGNLSKRYGDKLAVDGLSFVVDPGMGSGFLGPNGAGLRCRPQRDGSPTSGAGRTLFTPPKHRRREGQ